MKEVYLTLLEENWTLPQIDDMDFFYWLDLLIYRAIKKDQQSRVTIDQVF